MNNPLRDSGNGGNKTNSALMDRIMMFITPLYGHLCSDKSNILAGRISQYILDLDRLRPAYMSSVFCFHMLYPFPGFWVMMANQVLEQTRGNFKIFCDICIMAIYWFRTQWLLLTFGKLDHLLLLIVKKKFNWFSKFVKLTLNLSYLTIFFNPNLWQNMNIC